jgi:hypothetical protein
MKKILKKTMIRGLLASAFLAPFAMADDAEAREYCREYTKSVRINGRLETGYGTACEQEDGTWMIVSSRGNVDPFDELRRRNVRIVSQDAPVYYDYGPRYQPVRYYAPVRYRYANPGFYFSFGNDWNRHYRWRQNHRHHDHNGHHRGRRH